MSENKRPKEKFESAALIRILGKDISGDKKVLVGLTKIKGISWAFSNAICKTLSIDEDKLIGDLSEDEVKSIEDFVTSPSLPGFIKNRQKDFDSGEDLHLSGNDLSLKKEFDVKRLRKIKSYRGVRHAANLPCRGQRTKGNFRRNRKPSVAAAKKKEKK
jgi:small subunit ribosomal protein S13